MANIYRDGYKIFPFLQPLQRSGSVAGANMRLSAIDGAAFIDFGLAGVLTPYAGHFNKIIVIDSAGKKLVGYIKAVGTGETLGSNVLTNGDMESFTGWTQTRGALSAEITDKIEGTQSGKFTQDTVASNCYFYRTPSFSLLGLYKLEGSIKNITTDTMIASVGPIGNYKSLLPLTAAKVWTAFSGYYTPSVSSIFVVVQYGANGSYALTDNCSAKQILTPAATGVTITSTSNGSTYNWTSQEAGFDYNDANGYSFEIESIMKPAYLIGYRQESVQCYHDAMDMKISFGKQEERKKFPMRGMHRGF